MTDSSWPENYIQINRAAYEALAAEYRLRIPADASRDPSIVKPFLDLLGPCSGKCHVLDVGCGGGLNLALFVDAGCEATGIDVSPAMLRLARETCPRARLLEGDFLSFNFGTEVFDGVFAKAIIHLFTRADARRFLVRARALLTAKGILYVTTTINDAGQSGLRPKTDYSKEVFRYRRVWTRNELVDAVESAGFVITRQGLNEESDRGKIWFNIWAIKP